MFDEILKTFNSIDHNIQFTLEVPDTQRINFLDLAVWIANKQILYKKYRKDIASDNTLRKDSWLPQSIETNFVKYSLDSVDTLCSPDLPNDEHKATIATENWRLRKNVFSWHDINKAVSKIHNRPKSNSKNRKSSVQNKSILKLHFNSDCLVRKINKSIKTFDLNIKLVSNANKKLAHVFKRKTMSEKHDNCEICQKLPNNYNCEVKGVVYKFTYS